MERHENRHVSWRVDGFPRNGRWRVDWIGKAGFPDRLRSAYQPSIEICISKAGNALNGDLTFSTLGHVSEQRKIWTRVGYLPLLPIGSIWEDGKRLPDGDGSIERFFNVEVSEDTAKFVKAGQADDRDAGPVFYLPLDEHRWHMSDTQSWCVHVSLPDTRRLVIPCAELLRFYFGSSSNLLARLFRIPLSREMLYRDADLDRRSGNARIVLAGGIGGNAAADVARIAFDPLAWRAANQVGASLVRDRAASRPAYVRCGFPFEGITDLAVTGQWLSFGGEQNRTFAVHSIQSCSHEFPFSSLQYRMDWQKASTRTAGSGADGSDRKQRSFQKKLRNGLSLLQQDPSGKLAQHTVSIGEDRRFPDLLHKPVWKEQLKTVGLGRPGSGRASQSEHMAVGDQGAGRSVAPLELVLSPVPVDQLGEPPSFVGPLIEQLSGRGAVRIDVLTSSGPDGWTFPVQLLVDDDGMIDDRCFCVDGDGSGPRRRFAVIRVEAPPWNGHVLAVEGRDGRKTAIFLVSPAMDCNVDESFGGWIEDLLTGRRESLPTLIEPWMPQS